MRKVFIAIVFLFVIGLAGPAFSQCRTMDKNVERPLKVVRGTPTVVRDTIRLCTSHIFRFRATRGQQLSLKLATGKKTSLTLIPPSGEALVDRWRPFLERTFDRIGSVRNPDRNRRDGAIHARSHN